MTAIAADTIGSRSPLWFALRRIRTALRPKVTIVPSPTSITAEWNIPIKMHDGVILRANLFRPQSEEKVPAILSAHPYGKDNIPRNSQSGKSPCLQYHIFPQPDPITFSDLTGWEAPDPAVWVAAGYAVMNCDLRGAGRSDGVGDIMTEALGRDYSELIEWAAAQPWCNGQVGLDGVSYLCISQYFAAAERPPHLAAICPWEGISELYSDFVYPGGVREDGFSRLWFYETGKSRFKTNLSKDSWSHPERDAFWAERAAAIEKIEVPMLLCASFSDHSLHTRGSFNAYTKAASKQKWLYTHRDGKWCTYYSESATETRRRFFDHFLKGADNGWENEPAVRLAIHDNGDKPVTVTREESWPPADLTWRHLHLNTENMALSNTPATQAKASFNTRGGRLRFNWTVTEDIDIIGPMALSAPIELHGVADIFVYAGLRKFRKGREVLFEGSFGYGRDIVSKGWQRAAHRELDRLHATPSQPIHTHTQAEPLKPGEIVTVKIELRQHATRFLKGDILTLELRGTWFFPRDPLRGQFPGHYVPSPKGKCIVHTGGARECFLYFGARSVELSEEKRWT